MIGNKSNLLNKHKKGSAYLLYSGAFLLMAVTLFVIFEVGNKSYIWWDDGMYQHVNSLAYYGEYLRQTFTDFFHGDFELKMFEPSIGYGSDVITTLNYYVFGDPFAFFSVFVPKAYTEILFGVLIYVRMYLCGISFCYFLHSHNKLNPFAVSAGALLYTFCGYSLFAAFRHPYFLNPCIFFPLILVGIDKILDGKKPYLFIFSTAITAIFNVYFFYMLCLGMFIYAIFAYLYRFKKIKFLPVLKTLLKFIGYFAVGVLIASFIFLPSIWALLSSSRAGIKYALDFFYPLDYYKRFLGSFISWEEVGHWTRLCLTAASVLAVIFLFSKRKKNSLLKGLLIVGTVFLMFPVFGYVFNGFSYVSNRWAWMYCAVVAYVAATVIDEAESYSSLNKYTVSFIGIVIALLGTWLGEGKPSVVFPCFLLLVTSLIWVCIPCTVKAFRGGLFALVVTGVFLNTFNFYGTGKPEWPISKIAMGQACYSHDKGEADKVLFSPDIPEKTVSDREDKSISRFDTYYGRVGRYNCQMQDNNLSTSFYYSISNHNVTDYFDSLYMNVPMEQRYKDGDGRLALDLASGCRYFLSVDDTFVPYGYDTLLKNFNYDGLNYKLYLNEKAPNIVYAHKYSIPTEVFSSLTPSQKEQALLEGAVCDNSELPEKKLDKFFSEEKPFTVSCGEGVTYNGSSFTVTQRNAKVKLLFDGNKNSSTHVEFTGIGVRNSVPEDFFKPEDWASYSSAKKTSLQNQLGMNEKKNERKILFDVGTDVKEMACYFPEYTYYHGPEDFCVNMGFSEDGYKEITMTFESKGVYSFDAFKVVCLEDEEILKLAEPLSEGISDIKSEKNSFSCKIVTDTPKAVVFAVPYSEGWSAFVDGEKADLKQTGIMYMSVPVSAGEHRVEIRYSNPQFKLGIIMSLVGFLCIIFIAVWEKLKKKGIKMPDSAISLHKKH